ncbi:hypothetical protein F5Y16DRAFT_314929 [Xylariaceae sp. FL0255]|nr:hypothetical protein F5Y16DRAFT_314929 [Xylariaceae sp. FL0255]
MAAKITLPIMEDKRPPVRTRTRRRRHRLLFATLVAAATIYTLYYRGYFSPTSTLSLRKQSPLSSDHPNLNHDTPHNAPATIAKTSDSNTARPPVALEAHIMSKCPDAKDCLKEMILPAMIRASEKVNFTLSFIGTPTENDGVECKHGPSECLGNILELCAHQLYPDPKIWLGFTMCLTRDYASIPQRELIEDCALEHAVDIDKLNECAVRDDGAYGMSLLRDSVQRTASVRILLDFRRIALTHPFVVWRQEELYRPP